MKIQCIVYSVTVNSIRLNFQPICFYPAFKVILVVLLFFFFCFWVSVSDSTDFSSSFFCFSFFTLSSPPDCGVLSQQSKIQTFPHSHHFLSVFLLFCLFIFSYFSSYFNEICFKLTLFCAKLCPTFFFPSLAFGFFCLPSCSELQLKLPNQNQPQSAFYLKLSPTNMKFTHEL